MESGENDSDTSDICHKNNQPNVPYSISIHSTIVSCCCSIDVHDISVPELLAVALSVLH